MSDYTCGRCGQKMRFNVPRLGLNGGFVHEPEGNLLCDPANLATVIDKLREQNQLQAADIDFYRQEVADLKAAAPVVVGYVSDSEIDCLRDSPVRIGWLNRIKSDFYKHTVYIDPIEATA